MSRAFRLLMVSAVLAAVAVGAAPLTAAAQDPGSKSAALAKELTALLTEQKRDSIAARDPIERDRFIAAMVYPGQLMVVTGKYTVPVLLDEKISFGKFLDVYIELNGAAVPSSKVFIEDQFADGLVNGKKQIPYDSVMEGDKTLLFDGDHRKANMSKEEYSAAFAAADERYAKLLELLLAQLKGVKG